MPTSPSRPRSLLRALLVLFLLVLPVVEIVASGAVSRSIGGWATLGLRVLGTVIGAFVVKREGLRAWRAVAEATRTGRMPNRGLADGGLILVGGLFVLFPGFVSDIIGLFLLLPMTRPLARAGLGYLVARQVGMSIQRFEAQGFEANGPGGRGPGPGFSGPTGNGPGRSEDRPGAGTTVQGSVVD